MALLQIGQLDLSPSLVIFDKDGTLIDFNFMWASWVVELGTRLETLTGHPTAPSLYQAMGYDPAQHTVIAGSPLAAHSMSDLFALTAGIVESGGLSHARAHATVKDVWFVPDPVKMARPLADLPHVFGTLRALGILIGVATSDDRASTVATLQALGVLAQVNAIVTADDGLPNKPAPDMLLRLCSEVAVAPGACVMIGDSVADMEAARRAGVGVRIGVLSGVSAAALLAPHAHAIMDSVNDLLAPRS